MPKRVRPHDVHGEAEVGVAPGGGHLHLPTDHSRGPAAVLTGWLHRHPLLADFALAMAFVVVVAIGPEDVVESGAAGALAHVLVLLSGVPLVLRRKFPLGVLLVVTVALAVFYGIGCKTSLGVIGPLLAAYTVGVHKPFPLAAAGTGVATAVIYTGAAVGTPADLMPSAVLFGTTQAAIALTAGHVVRLRLRQAEQLRRDRDREAERAVTEERMRIAHELHDVVAHHLSVVSVQAGLARYVFDSEPETARDALGTISTAARGSLDELARLLSVLRPQAEDGPADADRFHPQPGLADLPALVESIRAAGVQVELSSEGEPRPLSPGAELCAYRVAQEALTNVLKHAPDSAAAVVLRHQGEQLELLVSNSAAAAPASAGSSGHGLIGMCERAKMYGGTVESGPRREGGFQVVLRLPRRREEH